MNTHILNIVVSIYVVLVLASAVRHAWRRRARPARVPAAPRRRATPILQPIVEERVRPRVEAGWTIPLQPGLPEVSAEIEWALDEHTERDVVNPIVRERERAEELARSWFGDVDLPTPGAVAISAAGMALQQKYGR